MPFPLAVAYLGYEMGEWRLDELAQERAAGEGMVERFVELKGIEKPRMLSWAEVRALQQDLRESVFPYYVVDPHSGRSHWPLGMYNPWFDLERREISARAWAAQYQQDPVLPRHNWDPWKSRCLACHATIEQVEDNVVGEFCPGRPP